MPACYTDRLSVRPGERFSLHASAEKSPCVLEIARIGAGRQVALRREGIEVGDHPTPANVDRDGCGWPVCLDVEVGQDWASGYYEITLTDGAGEATRHFVCVKPPKGERRAKAAFVLATNTYHAYNWWGGANAYCDVTTLMSGRAKLAEAMEGAIGVLSSRRPFVQNIVAAPDGAPRLVNMRPRRFKERPWAADPAWMRAHAASPYDGSAGFVNKWEHAFAAWAEAEGVALDYFIDHDLDAEPDVLEGYAAVILVGHSEYWSGPQRDQIERFVDAGGKLAIFSGNTAFWRVRWEEGGDTLVCHKWRGFEAEPDAGADGTHLWAHPNFGRPEPSITGLSFLYGGYHRLGMCVARGQGGYTVYRDRHWALDGTDLFYGDVVGGDIPLLGYENDGCRFEFGDDGLPKPIPTLGVPADMEIIAVAPCALGEDADSGYPAIIPPEQMDVCAGIAYGDPSPAGQQRALRGHAVMASFRRGAGEVFNGGTTEWAHALKAGDPFIQQITRNVLQRFGAL